MDVFSSDRARHRWSLLGGVAVVALGVAACAGRPLAVSPAEMPELEARLAERPNDADVLLRYAAALYSAGQCDSARVVAAAGSRLRPGSALGPLVIGQCFEADGDYDAAIAAYDGFLTRNAEARGGAAVGARRLSAIRARATSRAQDALAREADFQPADPQTLAVLPLDIVGDERYEPLSRGLAELLTSDLALLERFRMVERLQVQALFDEMALSQTDRVDQGTAVRMGRMLQAGRLVQGVAAIPDDEDMQLSASIVQSDGQVISAATQEGRLNDLLQLEKNVVIDLAGRLGYQLSEAERQLILENGTQNLTAFLAYSQGLAAEDLGDYVGAAVFYQQAVQADPGFQQARSQYRSAAATPTVQQASVGDVTTVADTDVEDPGVAAEEPAFDAVSASLADVAATTSEQTAATTSSSEQTSTQAAGTVTSQAPPTVTTQAPPPTVTGTIRIVFRLP
jgi:tetratricopeptide (TPR) repeat protein